MSKRQDFELLCDIKEAIQRIADYVGELNYDEFMKDKKTQDPEDTLKKSLQSGQGNQFLSYRFQVMV